MDELHIAQNHTTKQNAQHGVLLLFRGFNVQPSVGSVSPLESCRVCVWVAEAGQSVGRRIMGINQGKATAICLLRASDGDSPNTLQNN